MKIQCSYRFLSLLAIGAALAQVAAATSPITYVTNGGPTLDTGTCSTTTSACGTVAYAYTQTSAYGEIDIISDISAQPGLVIKKGITIDALGHHAVFTSTVTCDSTVAFFTAVNIATIPPVGSQAVFCLVDLNPDAIVLRNLTISMQTQSGGLNYGVVLNKAGFLYLENVNMDGQYAPLNVGVWAQLGKIKMINVNISDANANPTDAGVQATGAALFDITNSYFTNNNYGVVALGSLGASIELNNCVFFQNGTAVINQGVGGTNVGGTKTTGSIIRLNGNTITDNQTGVAPGSGSATISEYAQIISFGNNVIYGNAQTNGSPTATVTLK